MSNTELKKVKGRVQNKHKTEAEWLLDVYPNGDRTQNARTDAFIPLAGELIIYDPDSVDGQPRFKIGDPEDREGGRRNVDQLPFVDEELRKMIADRLAIQTVETIEDIPDDGTKLYRYGPESEPSHLVERISTYIETTGGQEIFVKTTTANNGQLKTAEALLQQFYVDGVDLLSAYFQPTYIANATDETPASLWYTFYNEHVNGIRIGTGTQGALNFTLTKTATIRI